MIECLRKKDHASVQMATSMFTETVIAPLPNPWVPVVDGGFVSDPFVPDLPEVTIQSRNFSHVPVLIGDNAQEGILFMSGFLNHPVLYENFTESLPLLLFNKAKNEVTENDLQLIERVKKYVMPRNKIGKAKSLIIDFVHVSGFTFLGEKSHVQT